MPLQHYIDQPTEWTRINRCVIIRGWCFSDDGKPIVHIRLRAGDTMLAGVTGLYRGDVKEAVPTAPDDNTGFEIRGTLTSGRSEVVIEAALENGAWIPIFNQQVSVKRQFLPLWLGGGEWMQLMFFQMPTHMAYAPRPVKAETFPKPSAKGTKPKISIVTPSYQQAAFLEETIRSVVGQTTVNLEYVVQDGGSTDGSRAIIERYAPQLSAWSSAPDKGQADAIATGFTKTTGGPNDLMAWINSDDTYMPGAFKYVADYFAQHPEIDVLYGHRVVINERSEEVARWFLPPHDNTVLKLNDFVPQETLFWRRRIWDQVGGLNTIFQFAMDWDLLLRFEAIGANIQRVPYFLACFRIHSAQKTAAQMNSIGRGEIDRLRERANQRIVPSHELETNSRLLKYLRRSSWIQFLWKWGLRSR